MKSPNPLASFRFAFEGIAYAFRTQRNFKVHCGVMLAVVVVGLAVRLAPAQWAILALASGLVFQAELMNTALEAVVDRVSPEFHALAKAAKDCAAGAVFLTALCAVVVGLLVLGPALLSALATWRVGN
ncbi:MAG: diacylglycerol kinase family protein [Chloroflexi bacterium]|jgi:diacylglycerol kinase|uniref:Diacylglycerol kinase n=1 Tax=Candidatus Thermofonsia Clade 3 bacterium TaxID=2364212 RepID=A0A2M8QAD3_9CHLR|nr:diacylglycerol kinase family protein [Candidatus Roseilinea sp. NK_OTU-006]PJF46773.1 MAG: diacylglycerol kinase [Candidatus Thermofonsia Clade 3 bacterium]RMG64781.1 MAG: diacylglycerol kinase family protein [Chloroflexota bacterium]